MGVLLEASEAPFFMSQILSKLDLNNNKHFGREMRRDGKEENVRNPIAWLHQETSIRSCGKSNSVWGTKRTSPRKGLKKGGKQHHRWRRN